MENQWTSDFFIRIVRRISGIQRIFEEPAINKRVFLIYVELLVTGMLSRVACIPQSIKTGWKAFENIIFKINVLQIKRTSIKRCSCIDASRGISFIQHISSTCRYSVVGRSYCAHFSVCVPFFPLSRLGLNPKSQTILQQSEFPNVIVKKFTFYQNAEMKRSTIV